MGQSSKLTHAVVLLLVTLKFAPCEAQIAQTGPKPIQKTQTSTVAYTENLEQFKAQKYNQRLEILAGCWLMSKELVQQKKSSNYIFHGSTSSESLKNIVTINLVKECMKKITRKEAVLKITSLVGKNVEESKKYEQIVNQNLIDQIFSQAVLSSEKTLEQKNDQMQTVETALISEEAFGNAVDQLHLPEVMENKSAKLDFQKQEQNIERKNREEFASVELSDFDKFLLQRIKTYEVEFESLANSKEGIKGKIEEELKSREKKYFGFIPANQFTHSVFLVTLSLGMMFCCTCRKYYNLRSEQNAKREKTCSEHGSVREEDLRKVAKMAKATLKRKR